MGRHPRPGTVLTLSMHKMVHHHAMRLQTICDHSLVPGDLRVPHKPTDKTGISPKGGCIRSGGGACGVRVVGRRTGNGR